MKLSTRARYALRLMVDLCRHAGETRPVQLKDAAERTSLSKGYLEHLATALRHASLLRSRSGPRGGYRLARPPGESSCLEISEAGIGPIRISPCVGAPSVCARSGACECSLLWRHMNRRIRGDLEALSLADLASGAWRAEIGEPGGGRARPPGRDPCGEGAPPDAREAAGAAPGAGPRPCRQPGARSGARKRRRGR